MVSSRVMQPLTRGAIADVRGRTRQAAIDGNASADSDLPISR
jgi:hypothetical protein